MNRVRRLLEKEQLKSGIPGRVLDVVLRDFGRKAYTSLGDAAAAKHVSSLLGVEVSAGSWRGFRNAMAKEELAATGARETRWLAYRRGVPKEKKARQGALALELTTLACPDCGRPIKLVLTFPKKVRSLEDMTPAAPSSPAATGG